MLNNPILQNTYTRVWYIMLCALLSVAYAFVFGWMLPFSITGILVDAVVSAVVMFAEAVLLWSVFTYSRLEVLAPHLSISVHIIYSLLSVGLLVGVESWVVYGVFYDLWTSFLPTLPARIFSIVMIYCAYRYLFLCNKNEKEEPDTEMSEESIEPVQTEIINRITVKIGQKIKVISVEDILYLKAEDDYVSIVTAEGHWLKSERLKYYEVALPASLFARVHRSYIVNIGKIIKIERNGQQQLLALSNGDNLHISIAGYKVLKEKLKL